MSRALAILATLALPLRALADEIACPAGAELRGEAPAARAAASGARTNSTASTVRA